MDMKELKLNFERLKERVQEAREKYYQSLKDIPATDAADYQWHLNRSYAYQHRMQGMERALYILIGEAK